MGASEKGNCLLCGETGVKLVDSHIIPKSLYGELLKKDTAPLIVTNTQGEYPKRSQKGVYEKIVCERCEALFSGWDDYACELFMKTAPEEMPHQQASVYRDIDNTKLKMFFLSLAWRMHVSGQRFFDAFDVGPYAEKLKQAVVTGDPTLVPEIDVVITRFDHKLAENFLGPSRLRIEHINGYRVGFYKHLCWLKVDKRNYPDPFSKMCLSNRDDLVVLNREFEGSPEYRAMIKTVKDSKK